MERIVREAYAAFQQSGPLGDLDARKAPLEANFTELSDFAANQAQSELQSVLDSFEAGRSLHLVEELNAVTESQWGYVVRIEPNDAFLQAGSDTFPLRPGMTATIDVTIDSRRIISYFFAPIIRTIQDAMGER